MTTHRLGCLLAHLFVLAYCAILLTAGGAAYVIVQSRSGAISAADYMAGYGLACVAAFGGLLMAARQVMRGGLPRHAPRRSGPLRAVLTRPTV
ncbi:hypothetical protein ACIBL5_06660 [Streptomyces sp. NPDC050516]|uniref:hypothetical protein n=1 Tax=Streptomyces sp. NPDC050516 TaxID=3365621 RepID=UPI00379D127D